MIYIAHRGLTNGPDSALQNNPEQIELALGQGYECEIDVWYKAEGGWYLGHDGPEYKIDYEFLEQSGLWIHAKNLAALHFLTCTNLNCFWHENDAYTLTSHGYIWTFPGQQLAKNSVMVMPEHVDTTLDLARQATCYAVCSDYVEILRNE